MVYALRYSYNYYQLLSNVIHYSIAILLTIILLSLKFLWLYGLGLMLFTFSVFEAFAFSEFRTGRFWVFMVLGLKVCVCVFGG